MSILEDFLKTLNQNSLILFPNIRLEIIIYLLIFFILFLENAIIPAVFLPGDSLLVIIGVLIAKDVLDFPITLGILTVAASLGSWISYIQGKLFKKSRTIRNWLYFVPNRFYQKAHYMFNRHGLIALFIGRFIAFVRTILPTIAGIAGLNALRFQLFNWVSSFIWVLSLVLSGFFLEKSECIVYFYHKIFI